MCRAILESKCTQCNVRMRAASCAAFITYNEASLRSLIYAIIIVSVSDCFWSKINHLKTLPNSKILSYSPLPFLFPVAQIPVRISLCSIHTYTFLFDILSCSNDRNYREPENKLLNQVNRICWMHQGMLLMLQFFLQINLTPQIVNTVIMSIRDVTFATKLIFTDMYMVFAEQHCALRQGRI